MHCPNRRTWAVLGGKYSKDHQVLFSFFACSSFWLIFMMVGGYQEKEREDRRRGERFYIPVGGGGAGEVQD